MFQAINVVGCRHIIVGVLSIMLPIGVVSCSSKVGSVHMDIRTIDVSGAEFIKQYNYPRSELTHADYLGVREGYHYLAVYQPDVGSTPKLQFYLRTPSDQLPTSFPDHSQMPIQTMLTPQQAADMMKSR